MYAKKAKTTEFEALDTFLKQKKNYSKQYANISVSVDLSILTHSNMEKKEREEKGKREKE